MRRKNPEVDSLSRDLIFLCGTDFRNDNDSLQVRDAGPYYFAANDDTANNCEHYNDNQGMLTVHVRLLLQSSNGSGAHLVILSGRCF
jgi:hypothetical protein